MLLMFLDKEFELKCKGRQLLAWAGKGHKQYRMCQGTVYLHAGLVSSSTASCWFSRWVGILDHRTIHRTWQEHFEKKVAYFFRCFIRKANSFRTVLWPSDVSSAPWPGKSTLSSLIFPALSSIFSWRISTAMFDDSRCSASSSEYRSRKVLKPLGHGKPPSIHTNVMDVRLR